MTEVIYYCEQGDPYCISPKCMCNTVRPSKKKQNIMNDAQFRALIEASEVFKSFEKFKQMITVKHANLLKLKVYHDQAERYGIEYLKQNPNLTISDVNLIESTL